MSRDKDLQVAQELAEKDVDTAYAIANRYLKDNPNDLPFLTVMVYVMMAAEKKPIAYHLAKRATQIAPNEPSAWINMGMSAQDLWQSKEAERAYKKGIKVCKDDESALMLLVNLCALYIDTGRFDEAEPWAEQALAIDPEHKKSLANLGFCQLAQRKWAEGWKNYRQCLGHDWRPVTNYCGEPEWDGTPVKRLALYAEQGLGDVISFASMVPDLKAEHIVLDVNASLTHLLQRSFPKVKVYGTRLTKKLDWNKEDQKIDASLSMGQVAEYVRLKDEDFPGTPYLVPCPDRTYMWRQLFKKKKKPVIGLAWRGGIPKTAAKYRQWDLEQLLPLLQSVDAHWVSLQYKPAGKEIAAFKAKHPEIDLVEYPHATLTKDYDDTAALVAALDHCVIMQTAIGHLCGGLGIPCWTFVPKTSQWRYGMSGEEFIWAKSVRLIRQTEHGKWAKDIERAAGELGALFGRVSKAAAKTARKGQLRRDRSKVRTNSQSNHRHDGDRPPA
jgi:cytochrome c-type biogenesis protein CcmH/NrfG